MIHKKRMKTSTIGMALMGVYVFLSFNAMDIWLPSYYNSISLVVLLAFGILTFLLGAGYGRLRVPIYSVWYLAFMLVSLGTMIYSPEQSILSGEFYLMIVSFVLTFMFQLFVNSEEKFVHLCWMYSVSSVALVLMLIFTDNMIADAANRLGEDLMGNANLFAGMVMVAAMYKIWLLVYGQTTKPVKMLLIAMMVADYYALILSAGRKFFIIPFVFLYILLWFKEDRNGKKHIAQYTFWMAILGGLAVYLIMTVPVFYRTIGYRMESLVLGMLGIEEHGSSAAIREVMRHKALMQWLESPLWGYGFDSFKHYFVTVTGYFVYSHCNYTELLYNGGIIYAVAYYWIFGRILIDVLARKKGQAKYRAFSAAAAICFLIFDYGAVTYSVAIFQIMLALSLRVLTFEGEMNCSVPVEKEK